ncbi:MAG: arylsulfatase [Verrucomicrobia bacterium]|nr:arylsulfatase [Verrucomicrobiota bacterium]
MHPRILLALLTLATSALTAATVNPPARPNVVIILADDMGFSALGCYGGEIPTPHLDALATNGVRFTQFYNTARCCPTRASLLTGLYPHQAGIGHMTSPRTGPDGAVLPGYQGQLTDRCVTIAEVLRPAGYFTAMTGKWHVGQELGTVPWKRGFDRSLNAPAGGFYFPDGGKKVNLFLSGEPVGSGGTAGVPKEWYSTDLWTDYGLKFIDEARAERKPFFLYLAHIAPHFPLQAPPEDIARFRGKFKAGWDQLRAERYRRQIALGLVDPAWPLIPRPAHVPAWDSLSASDQDRYDHIMAIYAATLFRMDQAIGRLVSGLRERGALDNTLIFFLSDNGGNAESGVRGRLEGANPGGPGSSVFVGECWAMLENTPFRRYKHFNHEGGIATPLIAHWPAGIPAARAGKRETYPGHLVDLMATCVDLAGANYPGTFNGKPIQPMEGMSLKPLLVSSSPSLPISLSSRLLFWEHEGNAAVRRSDWKLVRYEFRGAWELYNLKTDRTEQRDLAREQPALAAELAGLWDAWAKRAHVLPVQTYAIEPHGAPTLIDSADTARAKKKKKAGK